MTDPSKVLARIDSTIEAWELGPDAARWSPGVPEPQYVGLLETLDGTYTPPATWTEIRMETRPAPRVNAPALRMASEFQRQTEALAEGRLLAGALEMSGSLEAFITSMRRACESVLALARSLCIEPWPHGWNEPCFCHPKPFPAGRDYRRRTRHRNRRRKP